MKNKAAKKAKGGFLSIVFSRTALVLILILLQLGMLLALATKLTQYALYVVWATTVIQGIVVIYIINEKENPEFMCTWMVLILLFPIFGCLFYVYVKLELGSRYVRKRTGEIEAETSQYMHQEKYIITDLRLSKPANANLANYMMNLHFPTYRNTKATYYESGELNFPEMIRELEKAEKFIFMEYFIIDQGYMWNTVLDVLKKKAAEGVEVRLMYDGMNAIGRLPYNYPKEVAAFGIKCKMFSPIVPVLSTTQNNRDHRKICVVDGKVGFTGGINLADEYINHIERFGYWKDTVIMLEGDAVQSLTMLFLQMWNVTETSKEQYDQYLTKKNESLRRDLGFVLPYGDSPFDNEDVGKEVYFHILNHAKKYVHIMTPYLILDREMIATLTRAAKSGIDVKIIMPAIPDKWYAFAVAKTYYKELIMAGVKIYEFKPGFVHAKVFVSDDDTATVGSINLDYRSLYLHFECGTFIYNNPVVRDVETDFQKTLRKCHRVSVEDVNRLSIMTRIAGKVLRLIGPLM